MNYTQEDKKELVKAFKAAKSYLWDGIHNMEGKFAFICHCIFQAQEKKRISSSTCTFATEVIMRALGNHTTLRAWLHYRVVIPGIELTDSRVQAHRKAWLDRLIQEFSE